jgi:multidrug efflux pump subunit AcrA (membrane-fusion protein)
VPQQAVVVRDGFSYVFRLNADQRVSQIKVQPGRRVGERVEVLEGVGADAVLVASGAGFLNDGDLVK